MTVRERVRAGKDARVRDVAEEAGLPPSTLYSQISKGVVEARKIGGCVVIPNAEARRILGECFPEGGRPEGAPLIGVESQIAEARAA